MTYSSLFICLKVFLWYNFTRMIVTVNCKMVELYIFSGSGIYPISRYLVVIVLTFLLHLVF
jgi:hypothetical protein